MARVFVAAEDAKSPEPSFVPSGQAWSGKARELRVNPGSLSKGKGKQKALTAWAWDRTGARPAVTDVFEECRDGVWVPVAVPTRLTYRNRDWPTDHRGDEPEKMLWCWDFRGFGPMSLQTCRLTTSCL